MNVCVCVALVTLHEKRMRHIVVCGQSGCTMFFPHYLLIGTIFGEKNVIEYEICVLIICRSLSETILILKKKEVREILLKCT